MQVEIDRLGPLLMDANLQVTHEQRQKIPFKIFTPYKLYNRYKKFVDKEFNIETEELIRKLQVNVDNECSILIEMDTVKEKQWRMDTGICI